MMEFDAYERSFMIACTIRYCINDGDLGMAQRCAGILKPHIKGLRTTLLRAIVKIVKEKDKENYRSHLYAIAAKKAGEPAPQGGTFINPWGGVEEEKTWKELSRLCQNEIADRIAKGE